MADKTPEQIIHLVDVHERRTGRRRDRMDSDFRLWYGDQYDANTDTEGVATGSEFRSVTTNEPRTFSNKVFAFLSGAKLLIQEPYGMAQEQERFRYDLAERFYYGLLDSANESLRDSMEPDVIDQAAWYVPNRGWSCGLWLLMNQEDGTTVPVIKPWDARNVFYGMAGGKLKWACYRSSRTIEDLREEYPDVTIDGDPEDELEVYDYWDQEDNIVVSDHFVLKSKTAHGSPRCPVVINPVGWSPPINMGLSEDTDQYYGESIYAANRDVYNWINEALSIYMELTSKSRSQSYLMETDDPGAGEEDEEEDPNEGGGTHVIYIKQGEKFTPIAIPETTKDAAFLTSALTGMGQRGALPYSSYGELNFAISGYAIGQLNQQIMTVLQPQVKAIQVYIAQGLRLFLDQFMSGQFNPLTIRGAGNNRDYMQVTFKPEMLQNLPPPIVILNAELPEDDVAKMAMAQNARTGQFGPLLPDRYIWERLLKLQDTAQIDRMIKEQQARVGSPQAMSFSLAKASQEQGNEELAQVHAMDFQLRDMESKLNLFQLNMAAQQIGAAGQGRPGGPQGGPGPGQGQEPLGADPKVLPFIQINGSPAPGPRNAGPNRPPGAQRQGAQQQQGILGRIAGIFRG